MAILAFRIINIRSMKRFFGRIFTSCLGTLLAITVIGLFFAVAAMMGSSKNVIEKGSVLLLEFDTPIPELSGNVEQDQFSFDSKPSIGLHDIKKLIRHAQTDSRIAGIVYKVAGSTPLGTVTASNIRESLKEFRDSTDKFIYTYGDYFGSTSYLLASSSDSIFINPNGIMDVNGSAAMVPFFKKAMDRLELEMNVFYAGQFKSASEPFRRTEMSEQNKKQTREYLNDNFKLYLEEVAEARNIPVSNIKDLVNELDFSNTQQALDKGLIDGIKYWYDVEDILRQKLNIKKGRVIDYVSLDEYSTKTTLTELKGKNKIALIYAEGEVQYNNDNKGNINEINYHKVFDKIRKDKKVKAIVLRVNSPGGSAFTSDVIWRELKELKQDSIPIIASFGDYAASGGYYIAAGADKIVSHPKTLTGSIGVFSMLPNFSKFLDNKIGVTFDTVKTSPYAVVASPFYDMNTAEKGALQNFTDELYAQFLGRVAEGRLSTVDDIHEVAQGRVWTGERASKIGLVDALGDLDTAIDMAADMADIADNYKLVAYPKIKREFWEDILLQLKSAEAKIFSKQMSEVEKQLLDQGKQVREMLKYREPMARMPFVII